MLGIIFVLLAVYLDTRSQGIKLEYDLHPSRVPLLTLQLLHLTKYRQWNRG
jgi:hypothetical protein